VLASVQLEKLKTTPVADWNAALDAEVEAARRRSEGH
jgi:hypothetical protein